jgi:hypothetical protein
MQVGLLRSDVRCEHKRLVIQDTRRARRLKTSNICKNFIGRCFARIAFLYDLPETSVKAFRAGTTRLRIQSLPQPSNFHGKGPYFPFDAPNQRQTSALCFFAVKVCALASTATDDLLPISVGLIKDSDDEKSQPRSRLPTCIGPFVTGTCLPVLLSRTHATSRGA